MIGLSAVVNLGVSTYLYRQARVHDSPALEGDAAHLRADAWTSFAVLIGLILIEVTGVAELDSIVALLVASAIVYAGIRILRRSSRVLLDEALPADELDVVRHSIAENRAPELSGYHKLRGRRAGSRATSICTCSSRRGPRSSGHMRSRTRWTVRSAASSRAPRCSCTSSPTGLGPGATAGD